MFTQNGVKLIDSVFNQLEKVVTDLNKGIELCLEKKAEILEKVSSLEKEHLAQDVAQVKAEKLTSKIKELLS